MNRDLDFQHIKLSDFIRVTDTDITYAGKTPEGKCADCNAVTTSRAFRCSNCKKLIIKARAKLWKQKHSKANKHCKRCTQSILRGKWCATCRPVVKREYSLKRVEYEKRLSKFYTPKSPEIPPTGVL